MNISEYIKKTQYTTIIIWLSILLIFVVFKISNILHWAIAICIALWPIEWLIREIIYSKQQSINTIKDWWNNKTVLQRISIKSFIINLPLSFIILALLKYAGDNFFSKILYIYIMPTIPTGFLIAGCFDSCEWPQLWFAAPIVSAFFWTWIILLVSNICLKFFGKKKS